MILPEETIATPPLFSTLEFINQAVGSYRWNLSLWERMIGVVGRDHVLDEQRLVRVFASTTLIVRSYPETAFSEAMALGVPTVLLCSEELNERHPITYPLLDTLRSAGVVFHDPRAAAGHINAIWDDPDDWWESSTVVEAREEFRRQAILLYSEWMIRWTSFVEQVVV